MSGTEIKAAAWPVRQAIRQPVHKFLSWYLLLTSDPDLARDNFKQKLIYLNVAPG